MTTISPRQPGRGAAGTAGRFVRLAVSVLLLTILAAPAWGLESATFGMEPHPAIVGGNPRQAFHVELRAGGEKRDQLKLFNKTDRPLTLRIYAAEAVEGADGAISVGMEPSSSGPASWLRLDRETIKLGPKQSTTVGFSVRAPRQFPAGDEFIAALAVEPARDPSEPGVAVIQRLATVVWVRPTTALAEIAGNPLVWVALALLIAAAVLLGFRKLGMMGGRSPAPVPSR